MAECWLTGYRVINGLGVQPVNREPDIQLLGDINGLTGFPYFKDKK